MHKLAIRLIAVVALIVMLVSALQVLQAQVSGVRYHVVYDPLEGNGIMEVSITLYANEPLWLSMPINVFGDTARLSLEYYNYTGTLKVAGLNYTEEGVLEAFVYGTGTLDLYFTVSGLFEEIGVGAFEVSIDTTRLADFTQDVAIYITVPGLYEISSTSILGNAKVTVSRDQKNTNVSFTGIGEYLVTLLARLEEERPPTTTAPSPSAQPYSFTMLVGIVVAVVVVAVVLFLYVLYHRGKLSIVVEKVEYTDEATRAILKVLQDAGEKGLTQAEIVKMTNLPKSSVSRRIKRLEEEGFIEVKRVGKYNLVFLTSKGLHLAKKLLERK